MAGSPSSSLRVFDPFTRDLSHQTETWISLLKPHLRCCPSSRPARVPGGRYLDGQFNCISIGIFFQPLITFQEFNYFQINFFILYCTRKAFKIRLRPSIIKRFYQLLEPPGAILRELALRLALWFSTSSENGLSELTCKYISIIKCFFFFPGPFLFGHQPQTI